VLDWLRQRARFAELTEQTGFDLAADTPVGALRLADQQRVEILRAALDALPALAASLPLPTRVRVWEDAWETFSPAVRKLLYTTEAASRCSGPACASSSIIQGSVTSPFLPGPLRAVAHAAGRG
jgi:hypothetical protein